MASAAPDAFISYSREDAEFVDRLEADLRARGFNVWVDRRRLEGGREWEQEITRAVERYSLFIAILSKPAVQSPNVRFEHELAIRLGKRIVPVLYKVCPIPSALEKLQWIDFTDANAYPRALKELTYASQDPTLDLTASSNALYNQALALAEGNPERAAILLQRILDRDPDYFGGEVANEQKRLEQRLYASRVARLRAQAEQARQRGEYGVEAGALEAIIALGPQDTATYAWAQEYLPIAQQNRAMLGPYEVLQRVAAGDHAGTAERLRILWRQAPFFRDPAGIAPALGLSVPMTYEEAKDRRLAADTSESAKAKSRADFQARVNREDQRFEQTAAIVSILTRAWNSGQVEDSDRGDLDTLERDLNPKEVMLVSSADALLRQFVSRGRGYLAAHEARQSERPAIMSYFDEYDEDSWGFGLFLILWAIAIIGAIVLLFIVSEPALSVVVKIISVIIVGVGGGLIAWILGMVLAWLAHYFVILPLDLLRAVLHWPLVVRTRKNALTRSREAASAADQWRSAYQKEHEAKVQRIESERETAVAAAEAQYQQRLSEIAAEYAHPVAEIAQRYPQG